MPAMVGMVHVTSIGSGSVFNIGDVYRIAPQSQVKTFAGAGSFNRADVLYVYNHQNITRTEDKEIIDQPVIFSN
ncbi:MAG: spore germination protein [Caldibacillus sp.]